MMLRLRKECAREGGNRGDEEDEEDISHLKEMTCVIMTTQY